MSTQIKLSEEEINEITALSNTYSKITAQFGQIKIEKILLQTQLNRLKDLEDSLTSEYLSTQSNEMKFAESIQKKYGEGEINLETGFFIPGE